MLWQCELNKIHCQNCKKLLWWLLNGWFPNCNLYFSARQHLRSLAPVMSDFLWLWWSMISGNGCGLSFPNIYLTVEENSRKILNQENWPDCVSNTGSLGERQCCYPLTTAVVTCFAAADHWFLVFSVMLKSCLMRLFVGPCYVVSAKIAVVIISYSPDLFPKMKHLADKLFANDEDLKDCCRGLVE